MKIEQRTIILSVSILALIAFLFILFINILEIPEDPARICYNTSEETKLRQLNISEAHERPFPPEFGGGYRRVPIERLFLSPLLLMVAIIPLAYYFISKNLEKKMEKNIEIITNLISKNNPAKKTKALKADDKNIILKFLNFNERKVLEKLIKEDGAVLQSEISRIEGMTKLKTHRIIKDLKMKGLVRTENYGKTNRIILSDDIKKILCK